jgi:uncharacterized membrane protein
MDAKIKTELLKAEYLHIQNTIESFDSRVLSIKTWSVTTGLTGIGAAFSAHSKHVLIIAACGSLIFWFIEARWKTFQYAYHSRAWKIERYFSGDDPDVIPFQIQTEWDFTRKLSRQLPRIHVALPHAFVALSGIVIYILSLAGIIKV